MKKNLAEPFPAEGLRQQIGIMLEEETVMRQKWYKNEELENLDAERAEFFRVRFQNCRFWECSFVKASFVNAEFIGCDFSNCDFSHSYWKETRIDTCKAQGTKFCGSVWKDSKIENTNLDYANYNGAAMEKTEAVMCSFTSASLSEMKLKNAVFDRDKFDSTDFYKTLLKGIDLSGCELSHILLSDDFREVKGARLSALQAVEIAKMLGITVV